MTVRLLTLAGLAMALTVTPLSVTPSAANPKEGVQCMTDDGYGRYRPCSAGYKQKHDKSSK